ncbi:hypothetical protein GCM10023198_03050 [Promicromonospora umidemergens]|uniref:Uncharacterized protein n=1 Tax=Promicromonospora umidemergens TaxID=629679 RepID=A0ABP8WEG1_9MICO
MCRPGFFVPVGNHPDRVIYATPDVVPRGAEGSSTLFAGALSPLCGNGGMLRKSVSHGRVKQVVG